MVKHFPFFHFPFISKIAEFQVGSGNLLTVLDNWGPRFQIEFQFKLTASNTGWSTILHFTSTDKPSGAKGSRIPAIMLHNWQVGKDRSKTYPCYSQINSQNSLGQIVS